MQNRSKLLLFGGLTVVVVALVSALPPISQDTHYHNFADQRSLWGIPNFWNVVSNLPFLVVGVIGLWRVAGTQVSAAIGWIYSVLFVGVLLTGFGSAYYHWHPDNDRLVWDRVPMTIVFMSLLAATVAELVDRRLGMGLLFPLVAVGVASVLYWHWSELHGRGDLRWYGLVQFYPMVLIPLLIWLYWSPAHKPAIRSLAWVVAWYVVAKILEVPDRQIYDLIGISGHTLKHFAAAMSTAYFVQLFGRRYRRLGGEAIPGTNDRPGDRAA
jgi:hypothetical protein